MVLPSAMFDSTPLHLHVVPISKRVGSRPVGVWLSEGVHAAAADDLLRSSTHPVVTCPWHDPPWLQRLHACPLLPDLHTHTHTPPLFR